MGRNEPCHCGSGVKYKRCHLKAEQPDLSPAEARAMIIEALSQMEHSGPYLYAFNKLGYLVTDANIDRVPEDMLDKWNETLDEYLNEHPEERVALEATARAMEEADGPGDSLTEAD